MARSIFMVPVRVGRIQKLQGPLGHVRGVVMMRQRALQIGKVLVGIAERICPRVFFQRILRQRVFEMLQRHGAFEAQFRVVPSKVATATELSNGSCSQRKCAGCGVMARLVRISRRS